MYTHDKISKIKKDVIEISRQIELNPDIVKKELLDTSRAIMKHVHQYDEILNKIGREGICEDEELNKAFAVTEGFITSINQHLTSLKKQGIWRS